MKNNKIEDFQKELDSMTDSNLKLINSVIKEQPQKYKDVPKEEIDLFLKEINKRKLI